ncbi:GNAT family N-acetyltransferase [Dehalogenimonas sp. THU2]|uniref:GNAT family N-acetyltransferase n=1 Tax=Dehalogenimonas sp. THU2 TaxID=3151121 RepID=UPI00321860F8
MTITYQPFSPADYPVAIALWQQCEGIGLSDADSEAAIRSFLDRNPGTSFAAFDGDRLIGTVLGGHDGRRGYLYHLAVHPGYRQQGVGCTLARKCLDALKARGIQKCHLFIFNTNEAGINFWQKLGWTQRQDISVISKVMEPGTC